MAITLDGTAGVTTPGLTNSGNETITGTLNVGGLTPNVYPIVPGTAVASTSGTSIDFTSIPSWVRRITVMFTSVSTNGTSDLQIQLGAGSVTTSGYLGTSTSLAGSTAGSTNYTTGIGIRAGGASGAAASRHGAIVISLLGSNYWVAQGCIGYSDTATAIYTGSSIALGGTLDRVRITTVNGTDTFDAGSINLLWE
jgi:hypothetical protein